MKYCADHNCTEYKHGRPKFHKHCFECGKLLAQQPEEKVYQKMGVCENQCCKNYGLSNDTNVCMECGYVQGTSEYPKPEEPEETNKKYCKCGWCNPDENRYCGGCGGEFESPPKKVCVKTAVINALVFELRCLIEEESELDWASSTSCYAIRECRQALEKRIEKIREISDSQYERTCIDLQS